MSYSKDSVLFHYGIKRLSGRYPWGSGSITSISNDLRKNGFTEKEIAESLGISTTELRNEKVYEKLFLKKQLKLNIKKKLEKQYSIQAISKELGVSPDRVRRLKKEIDENKKEIVENTANILKKSIEDFKYIDVGENINLYLGISETKLSNAIHFLTRGGNYKIHYLSQEQLGTGKKTSIKVLTKSDIPYSEVFKNKYKIKIPNYYSENKGIDYFTPTKIKNVSSNRIKVVYKDEGGSEKDGLIELRSSSKDLNLFPKKYAQVRIGVDGDKFLKGMAVNTENIPDGYDIVFYTSKKQTNSKNDVFKKQVEGHSPFGANFKQKFYIDSKGERVLSPVNIVNEEGDWAAWNRNLSAQFLSKQNPVLAKKQLKIAFDNLESEYKEILTIKNPVLKKHLLNDLSDKADSMAVHMKAANLSRQTTSVLIPSITTKQNEIYAPNFKNGDVVSLVRYPHGGIFEIPTLTVNNKNKEMRDLIGNDARDAVGINPKIARVLSGADFDGDTVIVLPNPHGKIKTSPAVEKLKNFDPRSEYPYSEGMKLMGENLKQLRMGGVSNLITDMTVRGAPTEEIIRAVRHSMVVIDATKHKLDWQQSYIDHGIESLKKKYQGRGNAGASTIISLSSSEQRVKQRKDHFHIDPKSGKKIYSYTNETYLDKKGRRIEKTTRSTKGYETDDAFKLSSGTIIENIYAEHANKLKNLANKARLETLKTKPIPYSPSARKNYIEQVNSLNSKLKLAQYNAPLERKAHILGEKLYRLKIKNNPDMSKSDKKKEKGRALITARSRLGAKKEVIIISPKEWEAIESGAIRPTKLRMILLNADQDQVKQLAVPKNSSGLSFIKEGRARVLLNSGYTIAEVSEALGVSQNLINSLSLGV